MRRLILALAALLALAAPAGAVDLGLTTMGVSYSPSTCQGVGDIVASWSGFYGLHSYNGAYATGSNNAVNYRRASDNATQNGVILSNCSFDIASALTFAGTDATCTATIAVTTMTVTACASGTLHVNDQIAGVGVANPTIITAIGTCATPPGTCTLNQASTVSVAETVTATVALFVTEAYDQTGNMRHLLQATAADQPQLLASCVAALPCIYCGGSPQVLAAASNFTPTTGVMSISTVAQRTSGFTSVSFLLSVGAAGVNLLGGQSQVNRWRLVGSSSGNLVVSDSVTHIVEGVINGASSAGYVDNASSSLSLGSSTTAGKPAICGFSTGAQYFTGYIGEAGWIDATALTSGQAGSIFTLLNGYW